VYEHPACGKVGIREDFGVGNETKCPKCETVATDTAILEQVCQVVGCAGCDYRFVQFPTTADGDDFSLSPSGDDV
jgi:phage FluMu protein Com